ncbi:MAG: CPBP family intramembrane glutamic endopeptidase [Cyanobacteria bacterium J06614_10]
MSNAYIRLAFQGRNHWWLYVLGTFSSLFCFIVGSAVTMGLLFAYISVDGNPNTQVLSPDAAVGGQLPIAGVSPTVIYVVANLAFLFFFAGIWSTLKLFHERPFRTLITPATRVSWRRIGQGFSVFFLLKVLEILVAYLLAPEDFSLNFRPGEFFIFLPIVAVLTPLQTTTEELFFRGYLLQGIGSRLGKWMAVILPSLLFMLLHISNPEVTTQDSWVGVASLVMYYFMIGAFLAWLTIKEKSLELALGVHAANNMATFLLVTSSNSVIPSPAVFMVGEMEATFSLVLFTAIWLWLFSLIVFRLLRRPQV